MLPVGAVPTKIDVQYEFVIYAIWEFPHAGRKSVAYFLGEHSVWTTRFQGTISRAADDGYTFQPGLQNGNVGTPAGFTVSNAVPPEAKPPIANKGDPNWL